MLLKIFSNIFKLLIGDLNDKQKERAYKLFGELLVVIAKGKVEGTF